MMGHREDLEAHFHRITGMTVDQKLAETERVMRDYYQALDMHVRRCGMTERYSTGATVMIKVEQSGRAYEAQARDPLVGDLVGAARMSAGMSGALGLLVQDLCERYQMVRIVGLMMGDRVVLNRRDLADGVGSHGPEEQAWPEGVSSVCDRCACTEPECEKDCQALQEDGEARDPWPTLCITSDGTLTSLLKRLSDLADTGGWVQGVDVVIHNGDQGYYALVNFEYEG